MRITNPQCFLQVYHTTSHAEKTDAYGVRKETECTILVETTASCAWMGFRGVGEENKLTKDAVNVFPECSVTTRYGWRKGCQV